MQSSEPAFPGYKRETKMVERRHPMLLPPQGPQEVEVNTPVPGMSTRLYVATRAMEALIAKCPMYRLADEARAKELPTISDVDGKSLRDGIALMATQYADALIAACKENVNG